MPRIGAWLYDRMMSGPSSRRHYADIASDLVEQGTGNRLLDIGTGPGRLLAELRALAPNAELHGLDISESMLAQAHSNLAGAQVRLHLGNVEESLFPEGFFDVVACSGSFYLWDRPIECLAQIHRILAANGHAYLYESTRDFDEGAFREALRRNLKREAFVRRWLAPHFLRRQLAMTYNTEEVLSIIARTPFSSSAEITPIVLGGLPVWLRIALTKR